MSYEKFSKGTSWKDGMPEGKEQMEQMKPITNGQKASEIMADNKLHILNAQRTPTRINFEAYMRHLIFRHQGHKYKVLDDRRYTIT